MTQAKACGYIKHRFVNMNRLLSAIGALSILLLLPAYLPASEPLHHDLKVALYPDEQRLSATDTITLTKGSSPEITFILHAGLKPSSPTPGVLLIQRDVKQGPVTHEYFKVILPPGVRSFIIEYGGIIYHPIESIGNEQARGFKDTTGLISDSGVFLSGNTFWYPRIGEGMMTFTLEVKLPQGWDAVSDGERVKHSLGKDGTVTQWRSPEPQDEIYLVADRFTEYSRAAGKVTAMVFLRTPDEGLANKYLDATVSYIEMYDKLIGPYPYKKFALVENFWETGFGMPSFTLLGSQVIRLPFIINSSYPHEILHNWWGNSVFPDYDKGNWSEGLTAYLADHLMKEQQGEGAGYRLATLQKYADYVIGGRDFPLTQFRSRHNSSSEAIGYGKSLMFFHMLRLELGNETFTKGNQKFYHDHKFRFASFDDLRKSFESVSGKDLKCDFEQWVWRIGAPQLVLSNAVAKTEKDGNALYAVLEQVQTGATYRLRVPVAVTMEGRDQTYQTVVEMDSKRLPLRLKLSGRPLRIDIDPEFDLFRRLDREEIPPALSQSLGAKKMLILLPSSAEKRLLGAYRELAKSISRSGPDEVEIKLDGDVNKVPSDRAVTIIGWENRFMKTMTSALSEYDIALDKTTARIGQTEIKKENHSIVLVGRSPKNKDQALTWIASDTPEAIPGLARKLPHYHKYSYLAFEGPEPANVAKGRWPVLHSPLTVFVPAADGTIEDVEMAKLLPREPLATLAPVFSKERMMDTVRFLSSEKLKGRGLGTPELDEAAKYIAKQFKGTGLKPGGNDDTSYFQTWEDRGGDPERKVIMKNVIGVIPGKKPEFAGQSVVIGAHYDHLGLGWPDVRDKNKGKIHPGADDNASGVAVLVELARFFAQGPQPDRTIVFAAFTGEEAGKKGSKYYVASEKDYPASTCLGMVNLDTVGRLSKKKLLILGAGSAKEWVHIFRGAGFVTGIDIETVSGELDSSDQTSFQEAGVPAVQLFTGPHADYHRPADTADKIDADGLVKVSAVAKEAVEYLASREGPLTSTMKPGPNSETTPKKERKIALGTIPDFSYKGEGVRIEGVTPGSPAEASGLKQGDVIISVNSSPVRSLKEFSDALKSLNPGDRASITFLRDGKHVTTEATLKGK